MMDLTYHSMRIKSTMHKISWAISINSTISAYVAATKEYVLLFNIVEDCRFPDGLGYRGLIIKH